MASHEEAIVSLDGEIAELIRKLHSLRLEKSQHQARIGYCKGIITLARGFPPELLATIFTEPRPTGSLPSLLFVEDSCEYAQCMVVSTRGLWQPESHSENSILAV